MYQKEQIIQLMEKIGSKVTSETTVYLIGGGNLCLKGLKEATKDIDIILNSEKEFFQLKVALESLGLKHDLSPFEEPVYKAAVIVFAGSSGSRIDIFIKSVSGMLRLSRSMIQRCDPHRKIGKLNIMLVANEDIFLFKSLAGREKDLNDCRSLYETVLNWDTMINECLLQHKEDGKWIFWVYEQICRMEIAGLFIPERNRIFGICRDHWSEKPEDFMSSFPENSIREMIPRNYQKEILAIAEKYKNNVF